MIKIENRNETQYMNNPWTYHGAVANQQRRDGQICWDGFWRARDVGYASDCEGAHAVLICTKAAGWCWARKTRSSVAPIQYADNERNDATNDEWLTAAINEWWRSKSEQIDHY